VAGDRECASKIKIARTVLARYISLGGPTESAKHENEEREQRARSIDRVRCMYRGKPEERATREVVEMVSLSHRHEEEGVRGKELQGINMRTLLGAESANPKGKGI